MPDKMKYPSSVTAYRFEKGYGLVEREWVFFQVNREGLAMYEAKPVLEHEMTTTYSDLKDLFLTSKEALEDAAKSQQAEVKMCQSRLDQESKTLTDIMAQLAQCNQASQ